MATPTAIPERSPEVEDGPAPLRHGLSNVARRIRLLRGVRFAAFGVLAASLAALALLILSRFELLPVIFDLSLPFIIPAIYVLSIGAALLIASTQTIDALILARYVEQRLDLKERLSSALTLENQAGDVLVRLQRDDATRFADRIEPRVLIPWRLTWELPAAVLSVLAVLLAAFLPASPLSVTAPDRIARVETAREGSNLEEVARQVLRQSDQAAPPPVKDAARHLQKVARAMQSHQATPSQAVRDLQNLSDQIKKADQQAAGSPSPEARPAGTDKSAQARSDAQRELDRALNADAKGSDQKGNGPSGQGKNAGEGKSSAQASPGVKGNSSAPSNPASSPSGSASSNQHPGGAGGLKQQSGSNSHSQGNAQAGKPNPSGKPGAVGSKPGPTALASSQTQSGDQKAGHDAKAGKDLGKSATPGSHPTTTKPATDGELLGDKLRQYADKIAQRPMASGEREQAAQSLDQLNQKLNDAKMPETQKHVQAAAQALREGRQQDAVNELRQAADAADRETPVTEQKTSGQSSSQTSSSQSSSSSGGSQSQQQNGASQQMQRAIDQSKQNLSGQGKQPGQGQRSGQGKQQSQGQQSGQGKPSQSGQQGSGSPSNSPGSGSGKVNQSGSDQSPKQDTKGVGGPGSGGAHNTASHTAPKTFPTSGGSSTVVLKPLASGGRMIEKPVPGNETLGSASSTVPYYRVSPQFKKAAEKDAGAENIPPAYRQQVKKYFDSLTPSRK